MIGLGSCNDVVREFEIHSMKKACQAIRRNRSRQIDLGMVREGRKILRYYPGQASIGLAVLINQYVEQVVKRSPRLGKYQTLSGIRGGWQAFRSAEVPDPAGRGISNTAASAANSCWRCSTISVITRPGKWHRRGRAPTTACWTPSW